MAHKSSKGRGGGGTTFLGQAVARYDVDELDDLGKKAKKENYVEVKRPDGSVAKARGERTFYGAFTGGFNAGYWGTVGSREGWEPASFTSSRSKRFSEDVPQVEDFMDEEDLREHRSSHKTIAARGEFASRENLARSRNASESVAMPGGLPRELEEEVFSGGAGRLGARLLRAGSASAKADAPAAIADVAPAAAAKKSYGCARPPPGYKPAPVEDKEPEEEMLEFTPALGKRLSSAMSSKVHTAASAPVTDRALDVRLEKLWRSKTDMHGVGYALGSKQGSASSIPSNRRLYMSNQRGQNLASKDKAIGYGNFGTGVFDQDDYDVWEEVYDNSSDKHAQYHPALKDEDVDEEMRAAALEDVRPTKLGTSRSAGAGEVPGFVDAERPDQDSIDFSRWYPPPVPRTYRGVHLIEISPLQEAQQGSVEHKKLLEFQAQHGEERLMDPRYRAELLGEKSRTPGEAQQNHPSSSSTALAPPPVTESSVGAAAPLWQGVSDSHKQNLLNALGRSFVMGAQQDMDGGSARHEPFKSDPKKQKRYARFCMALEGKASASEVLKDSAGMAEAERQFELAEFGRVYQSFRQQNPDADIAAALEEKSSGSLAPVLRRTITAWTPDKLLCRRWGVPEPRPSGFSDTAGPELGAAKQQRKYAEQVQAGLAKAVAKAAPAKQALTGDAAAAVGAGGTSSLADPAPAATVKEGGDLSRPPKSLFTSIFGDESDDE